ncbi:uncharacterized protein [Nicotiana tomentosiformis]|uniref:uncharacterized protein n=1 Tax=Nicotiana tomentosiformis TaxID=4098 RepID=UPI00388C89D5
MEPETDEKQDRWKSRPETTVSVGTGKPPKGTLLVKTGLGKDAVLRPLSGEEETPAPVPKLAKDHKRKRASTSEDPQPKTRAARKPRKNTIPLTEESVHRLRDEDEEEEKDDGSILVPRVKKTIDAPKATGSMVVYEPLPQTWGISEKGSGKVPELLEIEDASHRSQQTALVVHREACSRSRAELSRYEANLRRVTEERNALRLLCGQREEEIRELRAELAKAHQDQTDLTEQQKLEVIGLLRKEDDTIWAETLGWKNGMDRLAAENETARAQLLSAESQLQGIKERSSVQARKIKELEARLASELAKAKAEEEKAKADTDAFMAIYRANAESAQIQAREAVETAQTRAHWIAELARCQSRRETLEDIHARVFDLSEEIKRAKELEDDAGALASDDDDDDDDDGSKSGFESGEEPDGEETIPEDNQET